MNLKGHIFKKIIISKVLCQSMWKFSSQHLGLQKLTLHFNKKYKNLFNMKF